MWTTRASEMKRIQVPVPPVETQQGIAAFLDEKTKVIDELVEKKEKVIELLREKRRALITHAVTKGLDSKAKMKPSGIDWLGDIPEMWQIKRLKDVISYCSRGGAPKYRIDEKGYKFINQSCIRDGFLDLEKIKYSLTPSKKGLIKNKDILINSTGTGTLGRLSVFTGNKEYFADTHVTIFRPNKISSSFVMYLIQNPVWQDYLYVSSVTGSTNQIELSRDRFLEIPIIFPVIEEQERIGSYLDKKTARIDGIISLTESGINQLKEYRASLIYSAVTGKIKV
jgi:type I restriction enzyme, S subunit